MRTRAFDHGEARPSLGVTLPAVPSPRVRSIWTARRVAGARAARGLNTVYFFWQLFSHKQKESLGGLDTITKPSCACGLPRSTPRLPFALSMFPSLGLSE